MATLIELCDKYSKPDVKKLLSGVSCNVNYVMPTEIDGFTELEFESREFMKVIFIHSTMPSIEDLVQDFLMVNGVGVVKAKKIMEQGVLLPEDLLPTSHVLWFRPNKNHVSCLIDKFRSARKHKKGSSLIKLPFDIVGGFGRGKDSGHDIDLLCPESKMSDVKDVMNDMETIIIDSGAYLVFLLDTMVRVDVSSFAPSLKVMAYMHHLGPGPYNVWMRKRAIDKGYMLSQKGLMKDGQLVYIESEDDVNELLGISKGTRERWWSRY
jgi:DNA polymerase/3'-5' exonuclease PolX